MVFGKNKDKGLSLKGSKLQVVKLGKKYSIDDVLIHDEKNKIQGLLLSELSYDKKFPTPLGIIYKEEKPTYETMLYDQIEKSVQSKGKGNLDKLFNDSHTWNV